MEKKIEGKKKAHHAFNSLKKENLFFFWVILKSGYHVVRIRVLQRPKIKIK
jgi:hypothetical protein